MKDKDSVRALICFSIKKETFFNLINVFDILHYFTLAISTAIAYALKGELKLLYTTSLGLLMFVSSLSYIHYQCTQQFDRFPQKLYSLVRMVYTVIDLAITTYVLIKVIDYGFFSDKLIGKLKNFAMFGGFGLISLANFYWNVLLLKTTYERRVEENEEVRTQLDVEAGRQGVAIGK